MKRATRVGKLPPTRRLPVTRRLPAHIPQPARYLPAGGAVSRFSVMRMPCALKAAR